MVRTLREQGYTIVMVEQNFRFAAPLADRFLVMEHGQVIQQFTQAELPARMERAARVPRRLTTLSPAPFPSPQGDIHETQEARCQRRARRRCAHAFGASRRRRRSPAT